MGEIEIDELLPGLKVGVLDRHVEIAAAHIVDEDVDRPGLREHALAEVLAQLWLGDVAGKVQTCRPRSRTSAAVFARASGSRAFRTMSAPASAAARAITRPKPRLPL